MKKIFLLIALLLTVAIVTIGISYVYLEKTKWYIEINGKKYKKTDFKKFEVITKSTVITPPTEKEIMNKYIEIHTLLENKEVNNFPIDYIEVGKRIDALKKKFEEEERFKNFLKENNITFQDVREYFIKEVKIDGFFKEKTKGIKLTNYDLERIYNEIKKHSSPEEMQFILQNKDRFEEEILKGKKNAYRSEYIGGILKKAKIYINK